MGAIRCCEIGNMAETLEGFLAEARAVLRRLESVLPTAEAPDWTVCKAARWRRTTLGGSFHAHVDVDDIALDDLKHIDRQKAAIEQNTRQFVRGLPANNVLLWGARGTGKSSLIHALLNRYADAGLRLVEVDKESLTSLPEIVDRLRREPHRFVLVCDDLSFDADDSSYRALKSALEGSIFRASGNVLVYATSNRRHLLPESIRDNEGTRVDGGELHESEAVEEKISLSDRFGLWLSFQPFRQDDYLDVVAHWLGRIGARHGIAIELDHRVRGEALRWALARAARNGRSAQYFARHWVGRVLLEGS
jgi:predicted AAA+ superfamily ATPase